jgi:hypothetical protein
MIAQRTPQRGLTNTSIRPVFADIGEAERV